MQSRAGRFLKSTRSLVRSIRFRLALWFTIILAGVLLAFSGFVYARQAQDMKTETLDRLSYKTRKLEDYLNYGPREYFERKRLLSMTGTQIVTFSASPTFVSALACARIACTARP